MATRRLPPLPWTDGIRGLACMYVIVWHAFITLTPEDPTPNQQIFSLPVAVSARETLVLFVLFSGYLLGRHWKGGFERDQMGTKFKQFIVRRSWRIVVPFWAAVTLTIAAMLLLGLKDAEGTHWDEGLPLTWAKVAANYLMITDVWDQVPLSHPHWTVPLEYHLYFFAPLIVLLRSRWLVMTLAVALTLFAVFVLQDYHAPMFPFCFVVAFWCGVKRQTFDSPRLKDTMALTWPIMVLAGGLLGVGVLSGSVMDDSTRNFFLADSIVCAVFMTWMFWVDCSDRRTWLVRGLSVKPARWLGDRSYSIYLMHGVVLECCWRFLVRPLDIEGSTPNFIILTPVACAASVLVAMVFFRYVEAPSARRSGRSGFAQKKPAPTAPVAAHE